MPKIITGKKNGRVRKANKGPLIFAPKVSAAIGEPINVNNKVPKDKDKINLDTFSILSLKI